MSASVVRFGSSAHASLALDLLRMRHESRMCCREEYEASREPYEDEKQLCATLITYLQKFLQGEGDADPPGESAEIPAGGGAETPRKI